MAFRQECGDVRRLEARRWFWTTPGKRNEGHDPVGLYPPRQSADVAVFEGLLRPQDNLDLLS